MWRSISRDLWARKRRLTGAGIAIVLGVAFLFATLTTSDTLSNGFDDLFTEANVGTDLVVRSDSVVGAGEVARRGTLSDDAVDALGGVSGVHSLAPTIDGIAQIVGADGTPVGTDGPPTNGGAWIDDPQLSPWRITSGRAPIADDEVVIDRGSARVGGLVVGDTTTVLTPAPRRVHVTGIATFGDADSLGPTTYVAFTPAVARRIFIDGPGVSSVRIAADTGVSTDELRRTVETMVPDGVEVLTGSELSAEQLAAIEGDFLGFIKLFLLAFAGVAILVATFSIQNTLSILGAQRSREAALRRAIGATRRQVFAHAVLEALVIGIVATGVGLVAGYGLGVGLQRLIYAVGVELPDQGLTVSSRSVAIACAVGVLVTIAAGIAPAVRSSRVAPVEALRDVAIDRSDRSVVRAGLGAVGVVAGVGVTIVGGTTDDRPLTWAVLGAVLLVGGAVLLGPAAVGPAMHVLATPIRTLRGATGRIAERNVRRNPRRTAASASALLVGTAVVALFTTLGASIADAVTTAVDESFGGDLVIEPTVFGGAGIDSQFVGAIDALPEVSTAAAVRITPIDFDGEATSASAVDPVAMSEVLDLDVRSGSIAGLVAGSVAIGADFADDLGVEVGSEVSATLADGTVTTLRIGAIYQRTQLLGDLIVTLDDAPGTAIAGDVAILVDLADGITAGDGAAAVDALGIDFAAPVVRTRDQYVDDIAGQVDQLLTLVYGLLGLAVVIALMGIANTLALSIHERTRELGLLRAVGQTRAQLRSSIRWESAMTAVFGTAGGVSIGVFLGWGLMRAVQADQGIGGFAVPTRSLVVIIAVSAASGIVAAIRPARRAARLDVIDAMSSE